MKTLKERADLIDSVTKHELLTEKFRAQVKEETQSFCQQMEFHGVEAESRIAAALITAYASSSYN